MQQSDSDLVEFAKSRLTKLFETIDPVDLHVMEQKTADFLEYLDDLCEQYERDGRPHSGQGRSLVSLEIECAWRRGLAPDGTGIAPGHVYLEKLKDLIRRSTTDPAAFDALALHASSKIADDACIPALLRRFVSGYLIGKINRPRPKGRRRKTALSDLAIFNVVAELVEIYGIKAVGNVVSEHEGSACAIVAQAMKELDRQPSSFSTVEKVWFSHKRDKPD